MRMAVIYARVSSEQQREEKTIASQTASLIEFAKSHDLEVPAEWVFEDEGFSGATLERPGLERVRDLAAEGQIQVVLAYSPDRLSRKYAYQILLMEEFARQGVETLFINTPQGDPSCRDIFYDTSFVDETGTVTHRTEAHWSLAPF